MTTDQELREMLAELARSQAQTERIVKQVSRQQRENAAQMKETDRRIGDIGNKFGSFTEGMALPSMEKILREQFGMNDISSRRNRRLKGKALEIDVLAYDSTGARNELYIVEVKSRLRRDDIDQILKTIAEFPRIFPELKDRAIYGIIAAVDIPADLPAAVNNAGLYLARISDDTFKLLAPRGFKPKAFGPAAHGNGHTNGRAKTKKGPTAAEKNS